MNRVLFDEGVPVGIRASLVGFKIDTAAEAGWAGMANGDLIAAAEQAGYEILVTTDRNLRYQNNLTSRLISLVVLGTTQWPAIRPHVALVYQAVLDVTPGSYVEVSFPRLPRRRRLYTP